MVAHETAATPALLDSDPRAAPHAGRARFHLLVPNPAEHAELTDAERRSEAHGRRARPGARPAAVRRRGGQAADGSVSIRHDPMDAIEETLPDGDFDEIILSTLPRSVSRWLHVDLPRRLAHLGLPVTTVIAEDRAPVPVSAA